jgi:hypothetical protein
MSPQAAAAWVAGVIGVITTFINLRFVPRSQKQKEQHERDLEEIKKNFNASLEKLRSDLKTETDRYTASIPLQQIVREHLIKTRTLLAYVYVSFDRLAMLAPTLSEMDILVETTNTLGRYAEYQQHLASHEYVSYPDELKSILRAIQAELTRIFLDLQIDDVSRGSPELAIKMKASLGSLKLLRDRGIATIEQLFRIRLDPVH